MDGLEFIQNHSDLRKAIASRKWKALFKPVTLSRAETYLSPARLLSFEITVIDEESVVLEAAFAGNSYSRYQTTVDIDSDWDGGWMLETDCSCPVGDQCKHAAALLLRLTSLLKAPPEAAPATPSRLDPAIQRWLHDLAQPHDRPPPAPEKPDNRFLAYCIRWPADNMEVPRLRLHVGRLLKNGEIRIDTRSQANADPLKPPKYIRTEDLLPCSLFHRRDHTYYEYRNNSRPLLGVEGHALLTEVLKTNRLFSLHKNVGDLAVREAEPLHAVPGWQTLPDGSATPTLGLPPGALLLPTSPLFILLPPDDHPHATLHPVETGSVSESLLAAWHSGPVVPATQVSELTSCFAKLPNPPPPPTRVETKKLPKIRPTGRLTLHRKNPFVHAGLHLSGQPEPIVAEIEFLYHGHPVPCDHHQHRGKLPPANIAEDGVILSIPRHKTGELELLGILEHDLGLVGAATLDPVPPKNLGCHLPGPDPKSWDLEWAGIISLHLPDLEEQGWEIVIDTSARIEVHPIGPDDLDTGLTELPEHGIDWFQFGASYLTPAGQQQSLLPLLSAYLEVIDPATISDSLDAATDDEDTILKDPDTGQFVSINTRRLLSLVKSIHDLFGFQSPAEPLHRLQAADLADALDLDSSETLRSLAELGRNLKNITTLPKPRVPKRVTGSLRDYQLDGYHWMQFLSRHGLQGILADDMGLGKTLQALTHLQAEVSGRRTARRPSLVVAPTSVVGNWANEAAKFTPTLKVLTLHGPERRERFKDIAKHHLVLTSYALLVRDFEELRKHDYHLLILDEAQYIKNPASQMSQLACQLSSAHRLALSGTPLENHLGELWSLMRFLMPGFLSSGTEFRKRFRTPIEKNHDTNAQTALNRRVAPLILRRTKDQVATELPPKTKILHRIPLHPKQIDLYETVRAAMDKRIRDAIADKGLAKSHIVVLDALLKLRQICCHPQLLKLPAAKKVKHSAKLDFLTTDLLPTLLEDGRKILLFSTFTSMLALIEAHLEKNGIPFAKITGGTTRRQTQIDLFQNGAVPVFLISLKAGGTGLNLTAADTVIHYDPWWNPAAENQATDRAHRIGQDKPVFVHKLICEDTIEQRIQELQAKKAALVEALLTDDTNRLRIDQSTLNNLLAPLT